MKNRMLLAAVVIVATLLMPGSGPWQALGSEQPHAVFLAVHNQQSAANPLVPFERLIGGQWHLDGSYHEFEWGLGRQFVTTRSYFVIEGKPKLVSEGIWFWHPGEQQIKGAFTAIDMPVVFFDYTVRFEGNRMVNDLLAYDAAGNETSYVETWEFTDDTHYVWKLLSETPDGLQEVMGGTYERMR